MAILASGKLDIQALTRAANLREVIEQMERGDVERIRDKYGPREGRPSDPMWASIKVTVNRRERLYHQLMDPGEFGGNKEQFFAFFASPRGTAENGSSHRKRKADDDELSADTIPFRLVTEAIPRRDKDIKLEREKPEYRSEGGSFSIERWRERWGEANDWEVWRALGKEHYVRR